MTSSSATVPVRISAASARQIFHGCEPDYIADVCHARCCESSTSPTGIIVTIHPIEFAAIRARGGRIVGGLLRPARGERVCPFKTEDDLCALHETPDKPFGCIASPFMLTSRDTLVVRNRYRLLRCFRDDRDGRAGPAYLKFSASLVLLFGRREAARIAAHLDAGGDDLSARMPRRSYDIVKANAARTHRAAADWGEGGR